MSDDYRWRFASSFTLKELFMSELCCKILTLLLGETPEEEFKVSTKGNLTSITLPLSVSLEGLKNLSAEEAEKIDTTVGIDHVLISIYV